MNTTRTGIFAAALLLSLPAFARSEYMAEVPNTTAGSCDTCHTNGGGSDRNDFGLDFDANRTWSDLAALDSDGDGCSNGEELGDPDGTWVTSDPSPGPVLSQPGDADDNGCDDGDDTDDDDDLEKGCATVTGAGLGGTLIGVLLLGLRRRS